MFDCIIIDDEQPARKLIAEYVRKVPGLEVKGEFKNPLDAMSFLARQQIDILFLDIQMPGLTGLEFIKTLSYPIDIILTTAYSEYALEGYELDVADYLMKPIKFERFLKAVSKVISKRSQIEKHDTTPRKDHLLIKADGQTHRVQVDEILFIEGLREYVTFHLPQKRIISLDSLKRLEEELSTSGFLRVHKSFIVNEKYISSHSGHFLMIKDKKIPIGANYRDDVLKNLF